MTKDFSVKVRKNIAVALTFYKIFLCTFTEKDKLDCHVRVLEITFRLSLTIIMKRGFYYV